MRVFKIKKQIKRGGGGSENLVAKKKKREKKGKTTMGVRRRTRGKHANSDEMK